MNVNQQSKHVKECNANAPTISLVKECDHIWQQYNPIHKCAKCGKFSDEREAKSSIDISAINVGDEVEVKDGYNLVTVLQIDNNHKLFRYKGGNYPNGTWESFDNITARRPKERLVICADRTVRRESRCYACAGEVAHREFNFKADCYKPIPAEEKK